MHVDLNDRGHTKVSCLVYIARMYCMEFVYFEYVHYTHTPNYGCIAFVTPWQKAMLTSTSVLLLVTL
jgi:hypothetical protein